MHRSLNMTLYVWSKNTGTVIQQQWIQIKKIPKGKHFNYFFSRLVFIEYECINFWSSSFLYQNSVFISYNNFLIFECWDLHTRSNSYFHSPLSNTHSVYECIDQHMCKNQIKKTTNPHQYPICWYINTQFWLHRYG